MSWLSRLFNGGEKSLPPHIQEAIDTAATAEVATVEAKSAIGSYWAARAANERVREEAMLDEYDRADALRGR